MLDLKSEICQIKNKQLQTEQNHRDELCKKNTQISQLEHKFRSEQQKRLEDSQNKQEIIIKLERDIEVTLQSQILENDSLKKLS